MPAALDVLRAVMVLFAAAGLFAASRAPRDRTPRLLPDSSPSAVVRAPNPDLGWRAITVMELDPFRRDRKAPSPRYDSTPPSDTTTPPDAGPPPVIRPEWRLAGILWGNPPVALFDDIAGRSGPGIFAAGDTVGDITIAVIWPDSVLVRHGDRAWTYALPGVPRPKGNGP